MVLRCDADDFVIFKSSERNLTEAGLPLAPHANPIVAGKLALPF
jgi:hypothetical protein